MTVGLERRSSDSRNERQSWCRSRTWALTFLSNEIRDKFFDAMSINVILVWIFVFVCTTLSGSRRFCSFFLSLSQEFPRFVHHIIYILSSLKQFPQLHELRVVVFYVILIPIPKVDWLKFMWWKHSMLKA